MKKVSKQFLLLLVLTVALLSCNNKGTTKTEAGSDTTTSTPAVSTTQKMDYPYTIEHPDNWTEGSQQNTFNALSALKAWENRNIDESLKYFADSVQVQFDGFDKKVSKDTLKAMISPNKTTKSVSVKMQDWESVISKDKKDEYVTLWYRQYNEDVNGKKDSVDVINDLKMKDGKIIGLDEYRRKLN